ncbi:MAG: DUF2513 domain-containing protein [Erysipelotrichaceae bacterium]|nr:DUF2513 domain-containing protein [Erysipelotrichaceae bacterium]
MAINLDCFRDVLRFFGSLEDDNIIIHYQAIPLADYSEQEILDTCVALLDAGLIDGVGEEVIRDERDADLNLIFNVEIDFYYRQMKEDGYAFLRIINEEEKFEQLKKQLEGFPQADGLIIKMIAHTL